MGRLPVGKMDNYMMVKHIYSVPLSYVSDPNTQHIFGLKHLLLELYISLSPIFCCTVFYYLKTSHLVIYIHLTLSTFCPYLSTVGNLFSSFDVVLPQSPWYCIYLHPSLLSSHPCYCFFFTCSPDTVPWCCMYLYPSLLSSHPCY